MPSDPRATLLERAENRPWEVVMLALAQEAKGEPLGQDLGDAAYMAGTLLAAATFAKAGLSMDEIDRLFGEREYVVRFSYDRASDEIGVTIDWEDGEKTEVSNAE